MENIQEITRTLMALMKEEGYDRLSIKDGDFEIELERGNSSGMPQMQMPFEAQQQQYQAAIQQQQPPQEEGKFVISPVVGTFYNSLDPKAPPCVCLGDVIEEDTVVGIVEAMKVMNEVKAGIKGVIAEILVENGHPVEYGTKIFRLQ